eukprot:s122_g29.t1
MQKMMQDQEAALDMLRTTSLGAISACAGAGKTTVLVNLIRGLGPEALVWLCPATKEEKAAFVESLLDGHNHSFKQRLGERLGGDFRYMKVLQARYELMPAVEEALAAYKASPGCTSSQSFRQELSEAASYMLSLWRRSAAESADPVRPTSRKRPRASLAAMTLTSCPHCGQRLLVGPCAESAQSDGLAAFVEWSWDVALEAYMFGRELLTVLTAGSMYTVSSVRVFAEQSECGSVCVSRASHWVALLNKRLSVGSTPQLRSHPQSLRGLLDTDISFLSMLMLLQLHGVLPISESEVLRFSFEPGPLGLALNAVMFGCLRSPDYLAWTRAFSAVYKRCPFSVPGAVLAADSSCFTHTYVVDDLGRCSDVTKELFQFMGRSTARRNRDIVGLVAADGMHFMRALQQQRYVDVIRVGTEIRGVGPFVMKNITVMLAHSPHASAKDFPWIPELLDPRCKESFVAAGTNGIPFASMLVGQSVEVDSGCDCGRANVLFKISESWLEFLRCSAPEGFPQDEEALGRDAQMIAPAREDGAHYERSIVVPHTDIHARLAVLRELPVEGRAVLEDLNSGGS